ncbi:1-acyl-sn-glycerol-3-phosphate acyltransferase [soil metagenome]
MKPASYAPSHSVVSEKAYKFVPPSSGNFWPWIFGRYLTRYLKKNHGIDSWELAGREHLEASLKAGHGILITPNHARPSDPMALGLITAALGQNFHMMASAHLFLDSRFQSWLLSRLGAFSVYREGMDRESLKMATDIIATAKRPLVIFSEGVITRTNDRLIHLQEGTSFIARTAAKQRGDKVPNGKVVVHPLAIRYTFHGELKEALTPILDRIETRLSWQPQHSLTIHERVIKLGHALLALRELEYFGVAQTGTIAERLTRLLDQVLTPLEMEWLKGRHDGTVVQRVKNLRKVILPDLVAGTVTEDDRMRRWKCLYDVDVAQQIFHFPPYYLGESPTPFQLIETVARYEEALGIAAPEEIGPIHIRFEFGEAIEVDPVRDKKAMSDPLMDQIRNSLTAMLGIAEEQTSL